MIKKKDPFKVRKQKLIDRINQCKTLKDIRKWEKTFSYYDVLKDDENWDYCYLLDLMQFKLKRMGDYFEHSEIAMDHKYFASKCKLIARLIKEGYNSDIVTNDDLKGLYVNTKNIDRFVSEKERTTKQYWDKYGLATLRERKAKHLVWKCFEFYIEILWD